MYILYIIAHRRIQKAPTLPQLYYDTSMQYYAFFGEVVLPFTFEKSQCHYLLAVVGSSFGYIKRGGKVSMKV
jgi:hypothetical protein